VVQTTLDHQTDSRLGNQIVIIIEERSDLRLVTLDHEDAVVLRDEQASGSGEAAGEDLSAIVGVVLSCGMRQRVWAGGGGANPGESEH